METNTTQNKAVLSQEESNSENKALNKLFDSIYETRIMANESCNDEHRKIGSVLFGLASMLAGLSPEAHYEDVKATYQYGKYARKILLGLMREANAKLGE